MNTVASLHARPQWGAGPVTCLLALPVLAWLYAPTWAAMARVWWTDTYAGHGAFVPLFSLFVVWLDRQRLRAAAGRGEPVGMLLVVAGLGVLVLGRWGESLLLQGFSIVAAIGGLVLCAFGSRCLKAAVFPIGFLVFMAPLPRPVVEAVTLHLQLFAAGFAGEVLDLAGVPFVLNGVWIELPGITLAVAEVCNGLRFLMGLLVVTIAFAQVSQRSLPRKLILAGSAIPIAILANAVRVAAVALAVYLIGPAAAEGVIHNAIAKVVWGLTLLPLLVLGLWLRRGGPSPAGQARPVPVPHREVGERGRP